MAKFNLLDTDTVTLNNIFERSENYKVPEFQRDYSWKQEQWEDLWEDIVALRENKMPVHYMGAIVLMDTKDKTLGVIDGQQRLATLSIVILSVIKRLQDLVDSKIDVKDNEDRKSLLMTKYIGVRDAESLRYTKKLTLNENNEQFYDSYLAELEKPPSPRSLSDSDKLLDKAFKFFYKKIKEEFPLEVGGVALAKFLLSELSEKLTFIQIVVEDEINAYTVFETLNSRGIELGTSDLLKNYLLSLTADSEEDKKHAKNQWKRITDLIDLKQFPNFLRYYWHSRYETIQKRKLYKVLRLSIENKNDAFKLLDELEKYADIYVSLNNPNDSKWNESAGIREELKALKLFGVSQQIPLLMVAYEKLPLSVFAKVVGFCVVIAFRYNVMGNLDPKKQERVFHLTAKKIYKEEISSATAIAQQLKSIYIRDDAFIDSFSRKEISSSKNAKLIRYILFSIENLFGTSLNFETDDGTIEHILPQNPPKEWRDFIPKHKHEDVVNKIGNLTLLEPKLNKKSGTSLIEKKVEIFKESQYKITNKIESELWNEDAIFNRQRFLGKKAKSYWKISQIKK